jgi:predicted DNA binding CopG/RHH family protein
MHTEDFRIPELDIPFVELDIPFVELEFEDLPSIDEILKVSPVKLSPPLTAGQTHYSERICIRVNRGILAELKKRAEARGERYQTYINQILAQHAAQ